MPNFETFPKPPSNEQPLLTEIGEWKARAQGAFDARDKAQGALAQARLEIGRELESFMSQLAHEREQDRLRREQWGREAAALQAEIKRLRDENGEMGQIALQQQDRYAALKAEHDKLQDFKDWVHAYLDALGVPHHPPGTHGAHGCRIGDRMDWLMAENDKCYAEWKVRCDALTVTAERQRLEIEELRELLGNERIKLALLRIGQYRYCDPYVRRIVADALLMTVEELEAP